MNKTKYFVFAILLLIAIPININATTINQLRNELSALQAKANANANKKQLTQAKMLEIRKEINETQNKIIQGRQRIEKSKKDIEELNKKIEKKNEEIKELIRFDQIADGENAYLEYLFGAKSFTDFIYRASIVEQLSSYNKKNITEMNDLIEQEKQLQESIKKEEKELQKLTIKLEDDYDSLGTDLVKLEETAMDVNDQVKAQKDIISMYKKMGCKDNQDVTTCSNVPVVTGGFNHPLHGRGYITSYYGRRSSPCAGCSSYHRGVDISGSGISGAPVYASATGRVATIIYRASCAGNQIYINHTINGKNYMTAYKHLLSMNVSVGQMVTPNTVIGYVGGGSNTPWDYCSTGPHLHFETAYGHYSSNYLYNTFNPASVVRF